MLDNSFCSRLTICSTHALALALELLAFVAAPVEMVLWSHHLLEPSVYLGSQIFNALLWTTITPISLWQLQRYELRPYFLHWLLTAHFVSTP